MTGRRPAGNRVFLRYRPSLRPPAAYALYDTENIMVFRWPRIGREDKRPSLGRFRKRSVIRDGQTFLHEGHMNICMATVDKNLKLLNNKQLFLNRYSIIIQC